MRCEGVNYKYSVALSLLASICYMLGYVNVSIIYIFAVSYLLIFYYLLFKTRRIEFYLFSLLVYRPFIKFILPPPYGFTISLLLIVYFPLLWYGLCFKKNFNLQSSKFLILFLLFSLIHGFCFGTLSEYIFTNRYLSLFIFVYISIVYRPSINFNTILLLFRVIFIFSLFVWLSPNYASQTEWLLCEYGIFSEPQLDKVDIVSYFLPRNFGFYYDCRIFGLFAVLYFCIALFRSYNNRKFDLILSSLVVLSTISRGAIVVWGFVLIGYYLQKLKFDAKHAILLCISLIVSVACLLIASRYSKGLSELLSTFSFTGEHSALGQREIFLIYALYCFSTSPIIGIGAGALKGYELFQWGGGYNRETYITDSFLASTLGEIGIVGFLLFLLYIFELYYNKSIFSFFLILGLLVQMLGTDVPDIGVQYFSVIYLFNSLLKSNEKNLSV